MFTIIDKEECYLNGVTMRILLIVVRKLGKRFAVKVMDKLGGQVVSTMADTSSDAPNAFHKPKRDLYSKMHSEEQKSADK